jgi:CHAT domain-containing protein
MLPLLLLLSLTPAESPRDVVEEVVRLYRDVDTPGIARLMTDEGLRSSYWPLLRTALETYRCVAIRTHAVTIDEETADRAVYHLSIDGTGFARGRSGRAIPFPPGWRIEVRRTAGGWRLHSTILDERVIARRLANNSLLDPATIVAAVSRERLPRLLHELLDELLGYRHRAYARETIEVIREVAESHAPGVAGWAWRMRGTLEHAQGHRAEAEPFFARAMTAAETSCDVELLAAVRHNRGTNAWVSGQRELAIEHYDAAVALLDAIDDPRPALKSLYMKALVLLRDGNLSTGLRVSAASAEAAARFAWTEGRCSAAMQQFDAYWLLRDQTAAHQRAVAALRCMREIRDEGKLMMAMQNLAQAERGAGRLAEASALLHEIIQRVPADSGSATLAIARLDLGSILAAEKRYAEAETTLLLALRMARSAYVKSIQAEVLSAIARVRLARGRTDEALATAREADALSRAPSVGIHNGEVWAVRSTLGAILAAAGERREAIATLESAIELIETTRGGLPTDEVGLSSFMADKDEPYRVLIALLADEGRLRDAVVTGERLHARALGTAVARGHVDTLPSISAEERERLEKLNQRVADGNRQVFAAADGAKTRERRVRLEQDRAELRAFLSDLHARNAQISARHSEDPGALLADAKRLLPRPGEAVLSFLVNENETFVFFLDRASSDIDITMHRVPVARHDLELRVKKLTDAIERRDLRYSEHADALYALLLAPFAKRLASKRLLVIVPDGVLWRLPFHALRRADRRHLIETVAVAYAPSLVLLRARRPRPAGRPNTLLAVGDPAQPAELTPIPDSRDEVLEIARMYERGSRVLVGAEATEAAVKREAGRFRILHLAAHGIFNDRSPMYSALVLAPSGSDDGLLEAREIVDLDLAADLAVLSACESAEGSVTPGEGVIGMSWALMVAGCRNTVVSQWKVPSRSTSRFMIELHRRLGQRDYATALQETQVAMMKRPGLRHPFYWSPFVLIATSQ